MKSLYSILLILLVNSAYGQTMQPTTSVMFTQCVLNMSNEQEVLALETDLRNNPSTSMVRLDFHSQKAFIITNGVDELSEEQVRSWFGNFGQTISCVYIGLYGVDPVLPDPSTNCQN